MIKIYNQSASSKNQMTFDQFKNALLKVQKE